MCHGVLYDDVMMFFYEDVKTVVALACEVLQDAAGTTPPPPQKMNSVHNLVGTTLDTVE